MSSKISNSAVPPSILPSGNFESLSVGKTNMGGKTGIISISSIDGTDTNKNGSILAINSGKGLVVLRMEMVVI
jgi:hypothetical protein